jgi:hypothetical protein
LQHPHAVTDLKTLNVLFESIRDTTQYHVAPFTAAEVAVVHHLLQWPTEFILPILDCLRVLMVHAGANAALGGDAQVHTLMFKHVKDGAKDTHKILALKIVSNWVAKRTRSPSERSDFSAKASKNESTPVCSLFSFRSVIFFFLCAFRYEQPSVPAPVTEYLIRTLNELSDAAASDNENLALAYVMLLHKSVTRAKSNACVSMRAGGEPVLTILRCCSLCLLASFAGSVASRLHSRICIRSSQRAFARSEHLHRRAHRAGAWQRSCF